jgi:FkbM family methyltransferase
MYSKLKPYLRPLARIIISVLERITGFYTDKDGYIPNRLKMLLGMYEIQVCMELQERLPDGGVFVDVGANIGYVSKYLLSHGTPERVIAIEANPFLLPLLKVNLSGFDNVVIKSVALSDFNGTSVMYLGKDSAVGSFSKGYAQEHHMHDPKWTDSLVPVVVNTVVGDDIFAGYESIHLLKIDIEGHELNALHGMEHSFRSRKIKNVLFEFSPLAQGCAGYPPEAILNFFLNRGFKLFYVEGSDAGKEYAINQYEDVLSSLGARGYTSFLAVLV